MTDDNVAIRAGLRDQLRAARRALPATARIRAAERLASRLLALPFAPSHGFVAGYWAMDGEIGLHAWQVALPPACHYCLPVLQSDQLKFAPWKPGAPLVTNRYGIPEPDVDPVELLEASQLAMAVAPLVGFDSNGERLGMGGGWYDRTFAFRQQLPAPPWLVGAAFALQQVAPIERAAWDVRLDAVCTEDESLDFSMRDRLADTE